MLSPVTSPKCAYFIAECVTYVFHSALDCDVAVVASLCSGNWRHCWHETKLLVLGWQKQNTQTGQCDLSWQGQVSLDNKCVLLLILYQNILLFLLLKKKDLFM